MAVKTLERLLSEEDKVQFIREVKIMSRLRAKTITQFFGACLEEGCGFLVMELMEHSLYDRLTDGPLAPALQRSVTLNIARGLTFLHQQEVLHHDLKSANVLLDDNNQAKLSDFGLSRMLTSTIPKIDETSHAIAWLAPELEALDEYYLETEW